MHRVDAIDPSLRRYGRFDIETEVTVPNEEERLQILEVTVWDTIFGSSAIFGSRSFRMIWVLRWY